jgi:hypothetical protein
LVASPDAIREELEDAAAAMRALQDELDGRPELESNGGVLERTIDELGIELNPENHDPRNEPEEPFTYIELSSVDRERSPPGTRFWVRTHHPGLGGWSRQGTFSSPPCDLIFEATPWFQLTSTGRLLRPALLFFARRKRSIRNSSSSR